MIRLQSSAFAWAVECFGKEVATDKTERGFRFFEESVELVQAIGISKEDCLKLVDYVYGRPIGEPGDEVGGVLITLAVLCEACDLGMAEESEAALQRVWENIDKIRAKHKRKPLHSPLPGAGENK
jgi:hypothetical protein